jgi:hypothetical protein
MARKNKEPPVTVQTMADSGTMVTSRSGMAAPTANVTEEARAACIGRALRLSEKPSSSRA